MGRYPAPYKQNWKFEFKKMSQEPKINFHTALISLQKRNKKLRRNKEKKPKQNKQKKKKAENKTTEKISKQ